MGHLDRIQVKIATVEIDRPRHKGQAGVEEGGPHVPADRLDPGVAVRPSGLVRGGPAFFLALGPTVFHRHLLQIADHGPVRVPFWPSPFVYPNLRDLHFLVLQNLQKFLV
jgi:hypothetical protein